MLDEKLNDEILGVAAAFVSFGFSPSQGNLLPSVLKELEPEGQTAMRDSILKGCQVILQLYQLIKHTRFADEYNFVMIVLTDGIDECSKASMTETIACLNQIRDQIPTHVLKIIFIGVDIDDQTEWELRTLADAADKNGEYFNISTDQLSGIFQKLSFKLGLQKRHQILEARQSLGEDQLMMKEEYKEHLHLIENFYGVLFNLDMSESMKGEKWRKLCAGTEYFIKCLGESDFVGCMVFNDENVLVPLNRSQLQEIVNETNNQFAAHEPNPIATQPNPLLYLNQTYNNSQNQNYYNLDNTQRNLITNQNQGPNPNNNYAKNYGLTGAVYQGNHPPNNYPLNNYQNYPIKNGSNNYPVKNYPPPPPMYNPPPMYHPPPPMYSPYPPPTYSSPPMRNQPPAPVYNVGPVSFSKSPQNLAIINPPIIQSNSRLPFYRRRNGRITILTVVCVVVVMIILISVLSK